MANKKQKAKKQKAKAEAESTNNTGVNKEPEQVDHSTSGNADKSDKNTDYLKLAADKEAQIKQMIPPKAPDETVSS